MEAREALINSLGRRLPTWEVARHVLALQLRLPTVCLRELEQLAEHANKQRSWYRTYWMNDDFDRVVTAERQAETFKVLFPEDADAPVDWSDPADLRGIANSMLRGELGIVDCDSATSALTNHRELLKDRNFKRAIRKRLRFLARLERKADRIEAGYRLRHAQMQAKSRLAYMVDGVNCDDAALALCAYLAARANRRSVFMLGPQSRARDAVVSGLEKLVLESSDDISLSQVALVSPTPTILARLDTASLGELTGVFHANMSDAAYALRDLYDHLPERMRAEMVMVKGVDSSRWNAFAGALNTMRSAWIASMVVAGLERSFDAYLPGKAPRLMASDLVWWYRNSGRDLHPDTTLFSALPHPWDVITGEAQLNRERILAAAERQGVNAEDSGWVRPRSAQKLEKTEAESALVHGVMVGDPELARTLRRCRVFSGKELRFEEDLPDALVRSERVEGERVTQPVVGTREKLPEMSKTEREG